MTQPHPHQLYYSTRAAAERTAAATAPDSIARRVHLELADRYESIVRRLQEPEPQSPSTTDRP
ncbi:hypothetical protein [Sphingomonas sp. RS2018]